MFQGMDVSLGGDPMPQGSLTNRLTSIKRVNLPAPKLGGKVWHFNAPGIYLLEEGPGTFRTMACTHGGSGTIAIIDGVPNEDGNFETTGKRGIGADDSFNGRVFYRAHPVAMGSWMLDGGFYYGLTLIVHSSVSVAPMGTVVWMPYKSRS